MENLNRCAQRMLFASLPRYTHQPTDTTRPRDRSKDTTAPLSFTAFMEILLDWVAWWNTEHTSQALEGRTPLAAWQGDPTPLQEADPALLWAFTLEGDGRVRALTTSGVRWRSRYYVGDWMTGLAGAGIQVRVRHVPHHDHEIEVFDAATDAYLGPAHLADAATPELLDSPVDPSPSAPQSGRGRRSTVSMTLRTSRRDARHQSRSYP